MCRKEYEQICTRAEGIQVILEFPAGPEPSRDGGNSRAGGFEPGPIGHAPELPRNGENGRAGGFEPGSIGHAPELPQEGKNGRTAPDDREMAGQEIREILTGVLLESMDPEL